MNSRTELDSSTLVDQAPLHLRWGAVFGGAVTSLALWLLLYALGLALGLSSMDPNNPGTARGAGIFTGVWSLVTPLIALFVGGAVASRGAGNVARSGAVLHGLVMWGLTTVAGAYLVASLLGSLFGTAASVGKSAAGAVGQAVSSTAGAAGSNSDALQSAASSFGLDAEDALRPVNERLVAQGKPPVTAAQLEATVRDVVRTSVQTGELDRNQLVSAVAQNSALTRQDAEEVATRIETQFTDARQRAEGKVQEVKQDVQTGALKAADATGKAMWGVFGALFLGLASAIFGALAGNAKQRKLELRLRERPLREAHP